MELFWTTFQTRLYDYMGQNISLAGTLLDQIQKYSMWSIVGKEERRIVVLIRPDEDIQVEFHIAKKGSPFEQLFPLGSSENGKEMGETVARFVADLLSDKKVLVMRKGFWKGGQDFIEKKEISSENRAAFKWIVSWSGN